MLGFFILIIAGICQGSFGLGYKKYNPLSWEAFWGIFSTFCFIVPLIWTAIQVPDFMSYFTVSQSKYIIIAILCGMFWGITGVGFSKGITYIGISLVYGLSMGISAIIGSFIPMITNNVKPSPLSLTFLIIATLITLSGIYIITKAGLQRKSVSSSTASEKNMKTGLILAILSGLGSAAMNIGFNYTSHITKELPYVAASALQWLPVLFGGAISSVTYCIIELNKKKTWNTYIKKGAAVRYMKLLITCIIWFTALAAYGVATFNLGNLGPVIGWIMFNALALIVSNCWGLKTGEWKGETKAKKTLFTGNMVLISSWIFISLSNFYY